MGSTGVIRTKLDSILSTAEGNGYSGITLVGLGSEVEYLRAGGLAREDIPLDQDSVMSIGSITKQFTATGVLRAEAAGLLSVGDYISDYLDDVPSDKRFITIHHLLTHTSGLESDFADDFDARGTREWYTQAALGSALRTPPGAHYHYSNAGFSLAAAILEIVTGQPYEAYCLRELFEPAAMAKTGYLAPRWSPNELVHGYRNGQDWGTIIERIAPDGPKWALLGNGGIHTTANDMFRWHRAMSGDVILPASSRRRLISPYVLEEDHYEVEDDTTYYYGYGWSLRFTDRDTRLVRHDGGDGIFEATFRRYLDDEVTILMMSNIAERPCFSIVPSLESAVFGALAG